MSDQPSTAELRVLQRDGLCRGHAVCDEHGAALRIRQHNQRPRSGDGPPFVVARIHSLRSEAS